jgi:hypothetical protein
MTPSSSRTVRLLALVIVLAILGTTAVAAPGGADGPPPLPVSYYGSVQDEGGGIPSDGTTIVAVGYDDDGNVIERDSIAVQNGEYGGAGGFEDKLQIRGDATTVEFYVEGTNGTQLRPTDEDPDSGVEEWPLTAPGGTFGGQVATPTPTPGLTPTPTTTPAPTDTPADTPTDTPEDEETPVPLNTPTGTPTTPTPTEPTATPAGTPAGTPGATAAGNATTTPTGAAPAGAQANTTGNASGESGGGGGGGGGLLPSFLGPLFWYALVPLGAAYAVLKGLAVYLGY